MICSHVLRERFWDILTYDVEDLVRLYGDTRSLWKWARNMRSMEAAEKALTEWETKMVELMDKGLGGLTSGR